MSLVALQDAVRKYETDIRRSDDSYRDASRYKSDFKEQICYPPRSPEEAEDELFEGSEVAITPNPNPNPNPNGGL